MCTIQMLWELKRLQNDILLSLLYRAKFTCTHLMILVRMKFSGLNLFLCSSCSKMYATTKPLIRKKLSTTVSPRCKSANCTVWNSCKANK